MPRNKSHNKRTYKLEISFEGGIDSALSVSFVSSPIKQSIRTQATKKAESYGMKESDLVVRTLCAKEILYEKKDGKWIV